MTVKKKIAWTVLGFGLIFVAIGAFAIDRQYALARDAAIREATNVAHLLGVWLTDANGISPDAQERIVRLNQIEKRDVVLVDPNQLVIADSVPEDRGKYFTEDLEDEIGETLKDDQPRTFIERSSDSPQPLKQIVVTVHDHSGRLIGAIVLEYTALFDELTGVTRTTALQLVGAGVVGLLAVLLIALYLGGTIANPLRQLTTAASGFAVGRPDIVMPAPRDDEIGELARAFRHMVETRSHAEQQLVLSRNELEIKVVARTQDIAQANEALQAENRERRRIEEELRWKTAFLEAQVNSSIDGILVADERGQRTFQNQRLVELLKMPPAIAAEPGDDRVLKWLDEAAKNPGQFGGKVAHFTTHPEATGRDEIELKDGSILDCYSAPVVGQEGRHFGRIWTFRDITERKRFETRLIQSQKMETVGKLAGGIAHEFNSILTAIIGQSELLIGDLPAGAPLIKNATEIRQAAGRAAVLTKQLLAYGRKQFLQPEIIDLNRVLTGMEGVLTHMMGGEIYLQIVPATGLHLVKADVAQMEQVVMNLIVNARDAMPNGGRLTIETGNVSLDQEYVRHVPELKAGDYVMLAISDTGTGMSSEVKSHVFEPFFSTKGVGEGSGLGLSTCYGIVKQSGGHINVYSEPGRGSTFKIYLPRIELQPKPSPRDPGAQGLPRGGETILLVEDDPALREMAATLLQRLGYTVLSAANGIEALTLKQQPGIGHIDLLFTDVVMPHMSGKELADRVQMSHPHTRILFTSAYTENTVIHQGALDKGSPLLQKPFTPSALAQKVRAVLDAPHAS